MPIRILIADDHGLIRAGLRALLEDVPDLHIVGEVADGLDVLRLCSELHPDVVLMDVSMSGLNGIETTRQLKEISPQSRVLALTVHEDEGVLREMIRAGGSGYIIKRAAESDLIQAIRVIMQGHMYVHPELTSALLKDISPHATLRQTDKDTLTPREIEVLLLLARGYTNRQIAQELNLSQRTIEGHCSSLVGKLGFSSRVELMNYVEERGLMEIKK
jgi:two-component system response regulator NreC